MSGDRFAEVKYVNWLMVNISLMFAKEALEGFTDHQVDEFHSQLKSTMQIRSTPTCNACTKDALRKQWKTGRFHCYGGVCDQWLAGLQGKHTHKMSAVEWSNSDISLLPDRAWECAKLFLPYGCSECRSANDVDIAALVTLYQNCTHFHGFFQNLPVLGEVKKIRNRVMHSSCMELETVQMQEDISTILELLQDPKHLVNVTHCTDAASKILELQSGKLEISLNKELELRALDAKIKVVECLTNQLHLTYNELDDKVQNVDTDVKALDRLKDDYRDIYADVQTTKTELRVMTDVITKCFGSNELDGVDTKQISTSLEKVQTLDGQMRQLKEKLVAQEKKVNQQNQRLDVYGQDIIVLQDEQKTMKRKIEKAETETKAKLARQSTKEEEVQWLQRRLLDLYSEHHQRVPIYPLRPTWKHPLKSLYVRQSMKVVDHRGRHEVVSIAPRYESSDQASSSEDLDSEMRINTFRDIFYDDRRRCKRIFVTGESGVGKSTLCRYLLSIWCSAYTANEGTKLTEDEKMMREFSLLFYIQLSNAMMKTTESYACAISTLIEKQLELTEFNIQDYLTDGTTLVVMDSLDEYQQNSIPMTRLSYKCTVFTTSRPWKLESLRSEFEGKIDKQIELMGLENDVPSDLADNVIQLLNKEYNKKKTSEDFMNQMQEKGLRKFLHIPVILVQMLCLWYDGEEIGSSLCQIYSNMIHHLIMVAVKNKISPEYSSSVEKEFPLNCKSKKCACKRFGDLLWKLSKLAYESLFREMPLVIDHDEISIGNLSEMESETCLKFGILTQCHMFGKITKLQKSVDFVHRTHQDFFASIFLTKESQIAPAPSGVYGYIPVSFFRLLANVLAFMNIRPIYEEDTDEREACRRLLSSLMADLDQALEIEKILLFTSGLNSQVASLFSDFIMGKVSCDKRIEEYRTSCKTWREVPNVFLIKKIQDIILQGLKEARSNNNDKVTLSLHDIRVDWRNVDRILPYLNGLDTTKAKSIAINTPGGDTEKIWKTLKQPDSLQKLQLYHSSAQRIHQVVTASHHSLQALGLDDVDLTSLEEKIEDLVSVPQLTVLGIGNRVLFTHPQLEVLCQYFSRTNQLRELRLYGLSCTTHGIDKDHCLYQINLSKHKNLTNLQLRDLSADKVLVHPTNLFDCDIRCLSESAAVSVFKNLSHAEKLEVFECWDLKGSIAINKLVEVLPRLANLQRILLWGIDFTQTERLQLSPNMKNLQVVKLWSNITITASALRSLIDSLPSHSVKIQIGAFGVCPVIVKGGDVTENIIQQIKECPNTTVIDDLCRLDEDGGDWIVKSFEFVTNKSIIMIS